MAKEIERKFLVNKQGFSDYCLTRIGDIEIKGISQGYLFDIKNHVGRIRNTSDGKSILTYKGPTKGMTRTEVEVYIPKFLGKILIKLCNKVIHKTRTKLPVEGDQNIYWEVDEFHNLNRELVMAEVEVPHETYEFHTPEWLGAEVTDNPLYYNSVLVTQVRDA